MLFIYDIYYTYKRIHIYNLTMHTCAYILLSIYALKLYDMYK